MSADAASRVTYPPLDTLKPVADGIWIVDSGPLSVMGLRAIPVRMTVVKLRSGEVWLHSPTRRTTALLEEITRIGRIGHLVAPSIAHWSFMRDWQQHAPGAMTWGAPHLRERSQVRKSGLVLNADLAPQPPRAWADDIDQLIVRGGFGVSEAAFLHRASRTLILTDLIENLEPAKVAPALRPFVRLVGAMAPGGQAPAYYRFVLNRNRAEVAAAARRLLAWAPERVVFAHGRWFERDGTARLRHALRWILD